MNLFDFSILFLICAGLSLWSLFFTFKLKKRKVEPSGKQSFQEQPFLSWEALPPAIMAFMVNIVWGAVTAFFPLYALNHGVTNPGLFFAAFGIVLILGRAFGGRLLDIYEKERIILPCLITSIISMPILAFSTTLPMFILAAVIWGMGNALLYPALIACALDQAGSSHGPTMGTFTAIADLGMGMGSVIMGIILQLTNYQIMFFCLAFVGVINLLYFYYAVRKKGGIRYANL
jgi:predicted MFS family arabinose efflux permease